MSEEKLEGKVKWFNQDKGFGFIRPFEKKRDDVFLHITDVRDSGYSSIEEGELVDFSVEEDNNGKERAVGIRKFEYVYD